MNAERLLKEPARLETKIRILAAQIDKARLSLLPGGVDYSADRVQGGHIDKYPEAMDIIIAKEEEIRRLNARRLWLVNERIPALIAQIRNELARDVVEAYYTTDATMAEVCEMVNVSNMTAYRYRWMGVDDIQKALDAES